MADGLALARLARQTLAEAEEVTLLIHGVGRFGADDPEGPTVVMRDIDGRPTFTCAADSLLARCAGRPAVLSVPAPARDQPTTLVLSGRLQRLDGRDCRSSAGLTTVAVALQATRVVLECEDTPGMPLTQHEVLLGLYLFIDSPAFLSYAASIVEHTNTCHEPQLRQYAAERSGQDVGLIAAACLAGLDRNGAELNWIDADGGQSAAIAFDYPARSPAALAYLLREQLRGEDDHPCR